MSKLAAKVVNPISIRVTDEGVALSCGNNEKKYEINDKVKVKGKHYGFVLVNCVDDVEFEETFPTQARISNIELNNGILSIYEYGKYNPWKFNNNGEMLENPTMNSIYGIEIEYPKNSDKKTMCVYIKK